MIPNGKLNWWIAWTTDAPMSALWTATNFFGGKYDLIQLHRQIVHQNHGIEIFTTSISYSICEENKKKLHEILLFQLFGLVLFLAHVYGSFSAVGARLAVFFINQSLPNIQGIMWILLFIPYNDNLQSILSVHHFVSMPLLICLGCVPNHFQKHKRSPTHPFCFDRACPILIFHLLL